MASTTGEAHSPSAGRPRVALDGGGLGTPPTSRRVVGDDDMAASLDTSHGKHKPARRHVRHRKQRQGQTIYKGHPSWKMMMNIKLGIQHMVGRLPSAESTPLLQKDFATTFVQDFDPKGTPKTPAHQSEVFSFVDHAPLAFAHLREHFGVSPSDYMLSICGESSLRELGTPGKSGAVFFLTEDGQYIIKTVSKKESKFLKQILPNYYKYVMKAQNTLLPRFFGLIRITTARGRRIRLVVMNNLMPDHVTIHEKFDLKGSTLGRWATEEEKTDTNVTLKDLDFHHVLEMPNRGFNLLRPQLEADVDWLARHSIMDYSLFALMHFPNRSELLEYDASADAQGAESSGAGGPSTPGGGGPASRPKRAQSSVGAAAAAGGLGRLASGASGAGSSSGLAGAESRDDDDDDEGGEDEEDEEGAAARSGAPPTPLVPKLSDGDLAAAFRHSRASTWHERRQFAIDDGLSAETGSGEVLLFAGVIDILQQYGARKRIEHSYKVVRYRSEREGISVTDPETYAGRFKTFLHAHFVDSTRALPSLSEGIESERPEGESDRGGGGFSPRLSHALSRLSSLGSETSASDASMPHVPPGEPPLLEGIVHKKNGSFPFAWSRRYAMVFASEALFLYFGVDGASDGSDATQREPVPRNRKALRGVHKVGADELALTLAGGAGGAGARKELRVRLKNADEAARWLEIIQTVIANHAPPSPAARTVDAGPGEPAAPKAAPAEPAQVDVRIEVD